MEVRRAARADITDVARFRHALWPHQSEEDHRADIERALGRSVEETTLLVAFAGTATIVGFAEASLRHDYVNGCSTSPVAFLEGIYVAPAARRAGVARALTTSVETWGASLGCRELASDAAIENQTSHAMHEALGFEESERVVFYRKRLSL